MNRFSPVLAFLKKTAQVVAKAWVIISSVVGSLVLVLVFIILGAAFSGEGSSLEQPSLAKKEVRRGGSDVVAVVNLSGPIFEEVGESDPFSLSSAVVASRRVTQTLRALGEDNSVKAVILRMNTPGGTVVASDEIYQEVLRLRTRKPVVTSMGDTAASGGYYIAAGSNKIVANPSSLTGSIGVIGQFPELSGLYDKLGIDMRVIKSGQYKDIGSPNRAMTDDERAILDSIVNDSYEQFVAAISEGRNMDATRVRQLADGRIYSGKQAYELGLVDELGNFDTAIGVAEELADIHNAHVVEFTNQSFFETLFESKLGFSPLSKLNTVVSPNGFRLYYLMNI